MAVIREPHSHCLTAFLCLCVLPSSATSFYLRRCSSDQRCLHRCAANMHVWYISQYFSIGLMKVDSTTVAQSITTITLMFEQHFCDELSVWSALVSSPPKHFTRRTSHGQIFAGKGYISPRRGSGIVVQLH